MKTYVCPNLPEYGQVAEQVLVVPVPVLVPVVPVPDGVGFAVRNSSARIINKYPKTQDLLASTFPTDPEPWLWLKYVLKSVGTVLAQATIANNKKIEIFMV